MSTPQIVATVFVVAFFALGMLIAIKKIIKPNIKSVKKYIDISKFYASCYDDSRQVIPMQALANYREHLTNASYRYEIVRVPEDSVHLPYDIQDGLNILSHKKKITPPDHFSPRTAADNKIAYEISYNAKQYAVRYDDKDLIISDNWRLNEFVEKMTPKQADAQAAVKQ